LLGVTDYSQTVNSLRTRLDASPGGKSRLGARPTPGGTSMVQSAIPERDLSTQIQRARELLDATCEELRSYVDSADTRLVKTAGYVAEAREQLTRVAGSNLSEIARTISFCNRMLDSAYQLVGLSEETATRKSELRRIILRVQQVLFPIPRRDGKRALPPPLPTRTPVADDTRPSGAEQRKSPRVNLETEVTFSSESNFFVGFSGNISSGGLFVATYSLLPIGTRIDLTFTLPSGYVIVATGRVRWIRDIIDPDADISPGMGIMFENLLDEERETIERFVVSRPPLFYD
jgi:uncharacterized protein (TIGR02266 family)